jgi:hypothetical protein
MVDPKPKIIKFHGTKVNNILIHYLSKQQKKDVIELIEKFDAVKSKVNCETVNIQVVAEFITITFYGNENSNLIVSRKLIPTHAVQHIWIEDLPQQSK